MKVTIKRLENIKPIVICIISAIVLTVAGISLFTRILVDTPADTITKSAAINSINTASNITIKKKIAFKRMYVVFADNTPVATVEGKTLPLLGETFSLVAGNGDVIATAKQDIFTLFSTEANISFNNKNTTYKMSKVPFVGGVIRQNDAEDKLTWGVFKNNIKENSKVSYCIKKNNIINKINIQKQSPSKYDIIEVILMSCLDNMNDESNSSSSNSSKNK